MIEIAAILVSLLLIAISTYSWIKEKNHKNKYKDFYSLPTPKPVLPIIGNGLLFYKFNYNIVKVSEFISETVGNPCVIYMPNETYCTSCPEELKIILNHPDCLEKGSFYKVLNTTFKQTLLIESVSKWKKNRKLVSKGFNQKVLDSSVESFNTMGPNLIEKLKKNNEDLVYLFQKFTLDNFTENFLNINFNFLDEKESEFVDMITNGEKTMARRIGNLIKMNDFCYNFTGDGRYLNKIMAQAFDFIQKILTNKRLELNENYFSHVETKELRRGQLLQLLLSDKDTTDEYIRKELVLLAGAATDTTAYSMAFTCVLLGMHPDIQKKVYEEVINIVGKDKEIEHNILPSLKYTEMAINESLRLLPVIPYTGRRSVADIHLGKDMHKIYRLYFFDV
ncbi:unnamed protein product [Brassicogethes aeneus]|uniref:Cytochrome P450 n=1 Tax=Brassicogethes aeneus TaxID=1431903 RepID=A0A9P0FJH1_BRAAE|nr:unnamed protein product [Brassicogethes aeneus]